jgi:6-phosphogluconolactonase
MPKNRQLLFVGSYTRNTASSGIAVFEFDVGSGQLQHLKDNTQIDNPSYICFHPTLPVLYCVNEVSDFGGLKSGSVSAYRVDQSSGMMTLISQQSTLGANPCHVSIDSAGQALFLSNYMGGSLVVFTLGEAGEIGEFSSLVEHRGHSVDPVRQKQPHVHFALPSTNGDYVCVTDLGLDQLLTYPLQINQGIVRSEHRQTARLKPGAGPRHLCFDEKGERVYLITELDNTLVTLDRVGDAVSDTVDWIEVSSLSLLPIGCDEPNYGAHVQLSSDGCFLYCSNRGHDSIAIFRTRPGALPESLGYQQTEGSHPRHFVLSADEKYLLVANMNNHTIVVLSRNNKTGLLSPTGMSVDTPSPTCLQFLP